MLNRLLLIIFLLSLAHYYLGAQSGGKAIYEFIEVPATARTAALGGDAVAINDSDLALVIENPALLKASMHQDISINYFNYLSDINAGYLAYAHNLKKVGTVGFGLQFINYGKFIEADITGERLNEFSAGDYLIHGSYAKKLHSFFTLGVTTKFIYSSYYGINSIGIAGDLSGIYNSNNKQTSAAIIIKNIGMQVTSYNGEEKGKLPFEIQAGIAQRLSKAPLRLSLIWKNMQTWDLTYRTSNDPPLEIDPLTGKVKKNTFTFDNIMRHINLGVEFIPSKNFHLRFGYNFQRRQELKLVSGGVTAGGSRSGLSGLSFGIGIIVKKIQINYALASYHFSQSSHHFSISTNLSQFVKISEKN